MPVRCGGFAAGRFAEWTEFSHPEKTPLSYLYIIECRLSRTNWKSFVFDNVECEIRQNALDKGKKQAKSTNKKPEKGTPKMETGVCFCRTHSPQKRERRGERNGFSVDGGQGIGYDDI